MKQLVAAVVTLTAIVAGIVLATSLSSSAQEDDGGTSDSTTTIPAEDLERSDRFGFRFDGDLPPEADEFLSCLREQGIEVPEDADKAFMFDLHSEEFEGLAAAIETCGLPGLRGRFADHFPFHGEFPEGFPFPGEGFEFHMGPMGVDRDELAGCLAALGSFDSVSQVREKLDECLPAPFEFGDLDGFEGFRGHRGHGGFPFGGHGFFDFDFDLTPELEDSSA
jgi:hypothetical protein